MIPKNQATGRPARAQGTDCCTIRCDDCSQSTYVSAAATTEEEIRAVAAQAMWTTLPGPRKTTLDICPEDTARRRRVDRLTRGDRLL